MRDHAANWLEVAERVFNFRRDQLSDAQRQLLADTVAELKALLKAKADTAKLKRGIEALEGVLQKTGGRQYPANSIVENVEFFLVAAIVILGLRAYFIQPFKIPTNSMWPTYYGMTHEIFKPGEEPSLLQSAGRFLALGASRYEVIAPADGDLKVPVLNNLRIAYTLKRDRMFWVIPTTVREYTFLVDGTPTRIVVPADFDLEKVLEEKFAGKGENLSANLRNLFGETGTNPETSMINISAGGPSSSERVFWLPLAKNVKQGEKVISFDILTGDLLFVDRISYNFFPPKVGQGFVFKTENINSNYMQDYAGNQTKQYYIKRLVGAPGDTLAVNDAMLIRNDQPIEGAAAFAQNAQRAGKYAGYSNVGFLSEGKTLTVEPRSYFAMGDNSRNSLDSRYWGFVPEKDVVGKPLFIYYPLTKRWGPAQ